MSVIIVLPEGEGLKSANGTKVFTDSGHEINGVTQINLNIKPNSIIEAVITVAVSEIENLEGIQGIIMPDTEEVKS